MEKFVSYIDSYEYISVLIDKELYDSNLEYYYSLKGIKKKNHLNCIDSYWDQDKYKIILQNPGLLLHKEYILCDNKGNSCIIKSGGIIREKRFDEENYYDGPLGVEYHNNYSIFRIWTPVAKEIYLNLYIDNKIEKYNLAFKKKGLWTIRINKNLDGVKYKYFVRVFEEFVETNDLYSLSTSANMKYDFVINPKKLYKIKNDKPYFSGKYTDSIIYEASVRDFTSRLTNVHKGTFVGLTDNMDKGKGLKYIKDLGITHLQLLPIFSFAGVDEKKKDKLYNWGYNPQAYFSPSGFYSMDPDDPYDKINELLFLIDEASRLGLRINMDVVYNHVYDKKTFPFDILVPGYGYRIERNGRYSNASSCGNVVASEKKMVRRFIIDNLLYFAKNFNISGFRFDLMGLIDIQTLNIAREKLDEIDNTIMLYGEGWNMLNPLPEKECATMYNHRKLNNYAFFNDKFRDIIRGNEWANSKGFAQGYVNSMFDINHVITGSCADYYKFDNPSRSINYVECHDNMTMYDYLKYSLKYEDEGAFHAARLALSIVLISQGIPFIHAGEEFLRTKGGSSNSYNASDKINHFDYNLMKKNISLVNTLKDLISIRKEYDVLRYSKIEEIEQKCHVLDGLVNDNLTAILCEGERYHLVLIIKCDYDEFTFHTYKNTYMIFDGQKRVLILNDDYTFNLPGVYIFRRSDDGNNY